MAFQLKTRGVSLSPPQGLPSFPLQRTKEKSPSLLLKSLSHPNYFNFGQEVRKIKRPVITNYSIIINQRQEHFFLFFRLPLVPSSLSACSFRCMPCYACPSVWLMTVTICMFLYACFLARLPSCLQASMFSQVYFSIPSCFFRLIQDILTLIKSYKDPPV